MCAIGVSKSQLRHLRLDSKEAQPDRTYAGPPMTAVSSLAPADEVSTAVRLPGGRLCGSDIGLSCERYRLWMYIKELLILLFDQLLEMNNSTSCKIRFRPSRLAHRSQGKTTLESNLNVLNISQLT